VTEVLFVISTGVKSSAHTQICQFHIMVPELFLIEITPLAPVLGTEDTVKVT